MKNLFSIIPFIFSLNLIANSNISQIPIESYMAQEKKSDSVEAKVDRLFYVNSRCSALFLYVASMTMNPTSEKEKTVNANAMTGAQMFNLNATNYWMLKTGKDDFDRANTHAFSEIQRMVATYEGDGENYYADTGNHLSGYIKSDMQICSLIGKEMSKN